MTNDEQEVQLIAEISEIQQQLTKYRKQLKAKIAALKELRESKNASSNSSPLEDEFKSEPKTVEKDEKQLESSVVLKSHFRYLDEFIYDMQCSPELLTLRVFPNAKEVTETLGAYNAARRFLFPLPTKTDFAIPTSSRKKRSRKKKQPLEWLPASHGYNPLIMQTISSSQPSSSSSSSSPSDQFNESSLPTAVAKGEEIFVGAKESRVAMVSVGDGSTPRIAATFAFRTSWTCFSVDPQMRNDGPWTEEYDPEDNNMEPSTNPSFQTEAKVDVPASEAERAVQENGKQRKRKKKPTPPLLPPPPKAPKPRRSTVNRLHCASLPIEEFNLDQFNPVNPSPSSSSSSASSGEEWFFDKLVLVMMHCHVDFHVVLQSFHTGWNKQTLAIIACPCCDFLQRQALLIGLEPFVEYEDVSMASEKRLIRVWKVAGRENIEALLRKSKAMCAEQNELCSTLKTLDVDQRDNLYYNYVASPDVTKE